MTRGCRTEVAAGETGPVVRKEAETDDGRGALTREVERLERARHPGVVELIGHGDDHLVLAWAGGETLETWRAPLPQVAALLAACSATIGDLHELGIVHGRLQARHVVVGPDGRPRLCGFGGSAPGTGEATPAGDVAAIGVLIERLVGAGVDLEPIPDRRWSRRRWSGYGRRSLQTLADHATDDDPARRPTARALAASIADAVPGCVLPAPGSVDPAPSLPPNRTKGGPIDPDRPPAGDDEAPRALEAVDHLEPQPGSRLAGDDPGPFDAPAGFGSEAPHDDLTEDDAMDEPDVVDGLDGGGEDAGDVDAVGYAPTTILGLRVEPPSPGGDRNVDPTPSRRPGREPLGRARVTEDRPADRVRSRRVGPVVVVAAAALALVGAGALIRTHAGPDARIDPAIPHELGHSADDPGSATPHDHVPASAADGPPPADQRDCPTVEGTALDLDGDGCPQPVDVDGTTIVAAGVTYRVGEAGDVAGVGDWNCDGQATPALVRPDTGELFVFDGWTSDDTPVTVSASYTVPGAEAFVSPVASTCGPPVLELRNGEHHRPGAEDAAR